jgi:hypothetical protein
MSYILRDNQFCQVLLAQAMKAYEFPAKVTSDGRLELPDIQLEDVLFDQKVRIIVLVSEPAEVERPEDADWSRLAIEQFFADNSEADAIYDRI